MWVSAADSVEGKASRFSRFYTCGVKTSAGIGYESGYVPCAAERTCKKGETATNRNGTLVKCVVYRLY